MRSGGTARIPNGQGRGQRKRLNEIFAAQQRWTLIGIFALALEACFAFALDWIHDPFWHGVLLAFLVVGGVGVLIAVPLGLGATASFWQTRLQVAASSNERMPRVSFWQYAVIGLGMIAAGVVYVGTPTWRSWLWPAFVVVSLIVFLVWRFNSRRS